jgi:hypothetical protein
MGGWLKPRLLDDFQHRVEPIIIELPFDREGVAPHLNGGGYLPGQKRNYETHENKRNIRKKEKFSFVSLFFVCSVFSLLPPISQTTVNCGATRRRPKLISGHFYENGLFRKMAGFEAPSQ